MVLGWHSLQPGFGSGALSVTLRALLPTSSLFSRRRRRGCVDVGRGLQAAGQKSSPRECAPKDVGCGCQNRFGKSHFCGFSVNSAPILEPILVVGLDVHWGYDLGFDPCPFV